MLEKFLTDIELCAYIERPDYSFPGHGRGMLIHYSKQSLYHNPMPFNGQGWFNFLKFRVWAYNDKKSELIEALNANGMEELADQVKKCS